VASFLMELLPASLRAQSLFKELKLEGIDA